MSEENYFPEWAKPGEEVLVVGAGRFGTRSFTAGNITRLTPTRIVVQQQNRDTQFVRSARGVWEEYGNRGDYWRSAAKLIHANTPEAAELYAEGKRSAVRAAAVNACDKFLRDATPAKANIAIEALKDYFESMEGQA